MLSNALFVSWACHKIPPEFENHLRLLDDVVTSKSSFTVHRLLDGHLLPENTRLSLVSPFYLITFDHFFETEITELTRNRVRFSDGASGCSSFFTVFHGDFD